jgi:hypothetical protein
MNIRMGAIAARLPKLAPEKVLSVVALHMEGKKQPIFLLTTLPASSQDEILRVITGYLSRWSVEETYRFFKTSQNLESIRTQSLFAIKQLVTGVFIATCFLWGAASRQDIRALMEEKEFRVHRAPPLLYNGLYRAADAISAILRGELPWLRIFREALKIRPRLLFSG